MRDYHSLSPEQQRRFKKAVEKMVEALKKGATPATLPPGLRVKRVQGTFGIWEMTWHYDADVGRATFEWAENRAEPTVLWRRIGGHDIFKDA